VEVNIALGSPYSVMFSMWKLKFSVNYYGDSDVQTVIIV